MALLVPAAGTTLGNLAVQRLTPSRCIASQRIALDAMDMSTASRCARMADCRLGCSKQTATVTMGRLSDVDHGAVPGFALA
jgi:hypothetical protein